MQEVDLEMLLGLAERRGAAGIGTMAEASATSPAGLPEAAAAALNHGGQGSGAAVEPVAEPVGESKGQAKGQGKGLGKGDDSSKAATGSFNSSSHPREYARFRRLITESASSGAFPSLRDAYMRKGQTRMNAFEQFVLSSCSGKAAEARMKQAAELLSVLRRCLK